MKSIWTEQEIQRNGRMQGKKETVKNIRWEGVINTSSRVFQKFSTAQLLKNVSALQGTRSSITVFTTTSQRPLSWARLVQPISTYHVSLRIDYLHSLKISSICTATGNGLEGWGWIWAVGTDFPPLHGVQIGSEAHQPSLLSNGYQGLLSWG
jgi:hypothetical protein